MLKTRITEFFGIERPIVQGGLMWVATAELVSAVANAGGMGFMTALSFPDPERLRSEIRRCRSLTDKPFGVNLTFLPTLRPPDYPALIDVCVREGVGFIETAGRNPEPYMAQIKSAGIKVIHKCTSVRHSIKAETIGCDAISIDGFEAAGHPGEDDVTSLILVPLVRDAVRVPIVASGGFADGRGLVAALALGADGMNMGTRFVATREAPVHMNLKQALIRHNETDTRVLRNRAADQVLEIESRGETRIQDLIPYVSGLVGQAMIADGDLEKGTMAAGQCIGLIRDIPTCRELLDRIMAEAEDIVTRRFSRMLTPPS